LHDERKAVVIVTAEHEILLIPRRRNPLLHWVDGVRGSTPVLLLWRAHGRDASRRRWRRTSAGIRSAACGSWRTRLDRLRPGRTVQADYIVSGRRDPLARRLDAAPIDDESLTDEEEHESLREAREDTAAGRVISMEELRRELLE